MAARDEYMGASTWSVVATDTHAVVTATKAAGTNRVHYAHGVTISFSGGTPAAGTVQLKDGSTVLDQWEIPAILTAPITVDYAHPLRGTNNTAMTLSCTDLGASIKVTLVLKGTTTYP